VTLLGFFGLPAIIRRPVIAPPWPFITPLLIEP